MSTLHFCGSQNPCIFVTKKLFKGKFSLWYLQLQADLVDQIFWSFGDDNKKNDWGLGNR